MINPYTSPAIETSVPIARRTPLAGTWAGLTFSITTCVAVVAGGWLMVMLYWLFAADPNMMDALPGAAILFVWITAPSFGTIGLASLFSRSLSGSIVVLLASSVFEAVSVWLHYDLWRDRFAPMPGDPQVMNCVFPIELAFPIVHWIGLLAVLLVGGLTAWIVRR